jgi:hypothetical protein
LDRDVDSHSHHSRDGSYTQRKEHQDRDTFLGAGAGAIVGDAIFPGLGTAAGILLGGLGGRKYAKRSKSEDGHGHHRHREARYEGRDESRRRRDFDDEDESSEDDLEGGYGRHGRHRERGVGSGTVRRRRHDKGWDEESATFKSGTAVR